MVWETGRMMLSPKYSSIIHLWDHSNYMYIYYRIMHDCGIHHKTYTHHYFLNPSPPTQTHTYTHTQTQNPNYIIQLQSEIWYFPIQRSLTSLLNSHFCIIIQPFKRMKSKTKPQISLSVVSSLYLTQNSQCVFYY